MKTKQFMVTITVPEDSTIVSLDIEDVLNFDPDLDIDHALAVEITPNLKDQLKLELEDKE